MTPKEYIESINSLISLEDLTIEDSDQTDELIVVFENGGQL